MEGRSQGEVARDYGVSQGWVSRLVARYRAEGKAAFEPRSGRPKSSPNAIAAQTAELITGLRKDLAGQGLDARPHTIAWHLHHRPSSPSPRRPSAVTWRGPGSSPPTRPNGQVLLPAVRGATAQECWQADFTHWRMADGSDTEILSWLDDHSRYALRVTAHRRISGPIVVAQFRAAVAEHGPPSCDLD